MDMDIELDLQLLTPANDDSTVSFFDFSNLSSGDFFLSFFYLWRRDL